MKMDSSEITRIQVATGQAGRFDLYRGIHKAMRALMGDVLVAVGRADPADEPEFARACARVVELADFCTGHLMHENEFIHPALEARQPGSSERVAHEHHEHGHAIARLKEAAQHALDGQGAGREQAALDLYRRLAVFIAHNFEHMHTEETVHNQALWAHYTDEELAALHGRLVASLPPEENLFVLRWMIPAMTPGERLAVLSDMQAQAPAPALAAALDVVRPHLDTQGWARLARGLGLAPVAGLVAA